eukprot:534770_1
MSVKANTVAADNDEYGGMALSTSTLFKEKDEALRLLEQIAAAEDGKGGEALVAKFAKILDGYLELPIVLDPHLESMVEKLIPRARELLITCSPQMSADDGAAYPFQVYKHPTFHCICCAIYHLCRVHGYKHVRKLLPHEASDLEPVLFTLQCHDRSDSSTWENRYILLLWLSMLVLVPFDIGTIDSSATSTLTCTVVHLCRSTLSDAALTREAAAVCLGSLLTRPDMNTTPLENFMRWCTEVLDVEGHQQDSAAQLTFKISGILLALAYIFKAGDRDSIRRLAPGFVCPLVKMVEMDPLRRTLTRKLCVKVIQRIGLSFLPPRVVSWRYCRGKRSLLQNLAGSSTEKQNRLSSLKASIYEGDGGVDDENEEEDFPTELEEVIEQLLSGLCDKDTVVRWSAAKGIGRITNRLPKDLADEVVSSVLEICTKFQIDTAWHGACLALAELARRGLLLPQKLVSAIPIVVKALGYDVRSGATSVGANVRDAACYVCWAFARAYSRKVMAPHVNPLADAMLVTALFDREINVRRAAAAAFQENVGRQGHSNFPHGIDIITAANFFTLGNRTTAYLDISIKIAGFERYRLPILSWLLNRTVVHWDQTVRKLGAEALGRLATLYPTLLLDREECLGSVLYHCLSSDICKRHGACLSAAEIVFGLSSAGYTSALHNEPLADELGSLVERMGNANLFRGPGGEMVCIAICYYVECMAIANIPISDERIDLLIDRIDGFLRHPNEEVSRAAAKALKSFTISYMADPTTSLVEKLNCRYVRMLCTDPVSTSTRGAALALGSLNRPLLLSQSSESQKCACVEEGTRGGVKDVIAALMSAAGPLAVVGGVPDVETRRNCLISLVALTETVGVGTCVEFGCTQLNAVLDSMLEAQLDYGVDKRGDTGSWCRMEGLKGLHKISLLAVAASRGVLDENSRCVSEQDKYFSAELSGRIICAVLKQLSEKLDTVRGCAGRVLQDLLTTKSTLFPYVPYRDDLEKIFQLTHNNDTSGQATADIDWSSSAVTFPMVIKAMKLPTYHDAILSGLILSVGGLTESVVRHSRSALLNWVKETRKSQSIDSLVRLAMSLVTLCDERHKVDRVMLPLLKTLELLLEEDVFDDLMMTERLQFAEKLLIAVRMELRGSKQISKLCVGANVVVCLAAYCEVVRDKALALTITLLGHRFPRVRKHIAECIYMKLLSHPEVAKDEVYEELLEELTLVVWDAPLDKSVDARNKIAAMFGIERLLKSKKKNAIKDVSGNDKVIPVALQDDMASYSSLVHDTGY